MNQQMPLRGNRFSSLATVPVWLFGVFTLPVCIGFVLPLVVNEFPIFWSLFLILLPLVAMTDREREVDAARGLLLTRWRLYRLISIWKTQRKISDFEAITCRRGGGKGTSASEAEWVALVRPPAKLTYIACFDARKNEICLAARETALQLAEATGLPIKDYPDCILHRRAPSSDLALPTISSDR